MPRKLRICIVTPGALGSNPRVVKEAQALHEGGTTSRLSPHGHWPLSTGGTKPSWRKRRGERSVLILQCAAAPGGFAAPPRSPMRLPSR